MGDNHHNDTNSQPHFHGGQQNDIPFNPRTNFSLLGYLLDSLMGEKDLRSKVDISLNE